MEPLNPRPITAGRRRPGEPLRAAPAPTRAAAPKLWFIDLDDTLFEASGGMLHAIHLKMNDFISRELGLSWEAAGELRTRYWREFGSTFLGLWRLNGVDPRRFLLATHSFDFAPYVHAEGSPRNDLAALPGRKIIFTNGPRNYAESVVAALGVESEIEGILSSTDMRLFGEWRPKPDAGMLAAACAHWGVRPREAALADDSPMNLKAAKAAGLRTVWCTGYRARHGKLSHRRLCPAADRVVVHIRELPRVFSR